VSAPRRRILFGIFAAAFAVAMRCPGTPPGSPCIDAMHASFRASAAAAQQTLEACWLDAALPGESIEACVARDPLGYVAAMRARAIAAEARHCSVPPAFGATSAAATTAAAEASADALAHGLFGRDLDAARSATDAGCQKRVLDASGTCADAYVHGFQACSRAALDAGADDAFDLVACKGLDPGAPCRDEIEAALADGCASADLASVFPGCAGDVAACARGHALQSAGLAINAAGGLCADVLPGSLPPATLLQCFEPPPPEPIAWSTVALPEGVHPVTVEWQPGDEWLVFSYNAADVTETQIGTARSDGSEFRCLSCGSAITGNLRPVQRFADGRRVLVAGPNGATARWNVLECTPSLLDCQSSVLLPIRPPVNPDPATSILQYRVPWVTLDDEWLVWSEVRLRGPGGNLSAMGRLVREPTRYVLADARVIAPTFDPAGLGTDAEKWRAITQPLEAKFGALRGGRDWVEAGTPNAGHYDTSVLDLATGDLRRLTHHPDHDEGIRCSRDDRWAVLQSSRTDNRVEFLGLLPRPPYVDWIAFSIHFVGIAGAPGEGGAPGGPNAERDCYVDPWLLDTWFERGDYVGQRLLTPTEDGWASIEGNAGGFGWSNDGTRIALIERVWARLTPAGEAPTTRIRIATLTSRNPIASEDVVPILPTPEPTWATRYEDYRVPDTAGVTVVPGLVSGTATIRNDMPTAVQGEVEVVYAGYSDDGATFLDGRELLRIPELVLNGAEYEVELGLSGAHVGSMIGSIVYDFVADVNDGWVVSTLDGRVVEGPSTCYDAGLIPIP